MLGEGDVGLHLAGIGIEDVAEATGGAGHFFAADEMADLAHGVLPVSGLRPCGLAAGPSTVR
jgi:hypothetical protein